MVGTIKDAVAVATKDVAVEKLTEISLDGVKCKDLEDLAQFAFTSLEKLSLSNLGLSSLEKCPDLPNLTQLDINGNDIASGLDVLLKCPKLEILGLNDNKIADVSVLAPLKELKHLRQINLKGCEIANVNEYRKLVKEVLAQVEVIDGEDFKSSNGHTNGAEKNGNGNSVESDDEEDEDEDDDDEDEEDDGPGLADLLSDKPLEDDEDDFEPGDEDDEDEEELDISMTEGDAVVCAGGGTSANIVSGKRKISDVDGEEEETSAKK